MTSISVIVPAYNGGQFLAQSLDSALGLRTGATVQIIVVDDGSTDGTRELRPVYSGLPSVTWIEHPANRGKLAALNTAAEVIEGDHVIVLDADDRLHADYIERCLEAQHAAGCDFVYSGCDLIDRQGDTLSQGRSIAFDAELIETCSFIPDCAFTSREAFMAVIPLDEAVRRLPKHHRWKRICRLGFSGKYLDESLFDYRMHESNMSGIGRSILKEIAAGERHHRLLAGYWEPHTSDGASRASP